MGWHFGFVELKTQGCHRFLFQGLDIFGYGVTQEATCNGTRGGSDHSSGFATDRFPDSGPGDPASRSRNGSGFGVVC